jgi:gamma-glutamyltranspeptidase/glutathione hydrolase
MSIGSPGGPYIISGVLQVLYRTLAQKMDLDLAVQTPRVHNQFMPSKLYLEPKRFSPEIVEALRARKHIVEESGGGKVYVVRLRADGILEGAFDSRGEGAAGGY